MTLSFFHFALIGYYLIGVGIAGMVLFDRRMPDHIHDIIGPTVVPPQLMAVVTVISCLLMAALWPYILLIPYLRNDDE